MKKYLLLLILVAGFLSSCAPKLTPFITMYNEPLSPGDPVIELPRSVELKDGYDMLGVVKVSNVNFSNYQDSIIVMYKIKEEARKVGGNAIIMTSDKKKASILSLSDSLLYDSYPPLIEIAKREEKKLVENSLFVEELVKPRLLPSFVLAGNIGYGYRTPKVDSRLTGTDKEIAKDTKSGMTWDASAKYYFNDKYGVGGMFSLFTSSSDVLAPIKTTNKITFVGPAFLVRGGFGENKWILDCSLGLGYIGYELSAKYMGQYEKYTGASVGMLADLGLEHRFHENFGIAFNLTSTVGVLSEMTFNENGNKTTIKFDDDTLEGLHNVRLSIGLRYYIK